MLTVVIMFNKFYLNNLILLPTKHKTIANCWLGAVRFAFPELLNFSFTLNERYIYIPVNFLQISLQILEGKATCLLRRMTSRDLF